MIIGLAGYAGVGKSTAARALVELGWERHRFAAPMKKMLLSLLIEGGIGFITAMEMVDGKLKEDPHELLGGKSPRYALQTIGTEWGRGLFGQNFWVNQTMAKIKPSISKGKRIVIDDVRFPNEASAIRAAGGKTIRIQRGNNRWAEHSSETQEFQCDWEITNDLDETHLIASITAISESPI
jgi:hypothetical protein